MTSKVQTVAPAPVYFAGVFRPNMPQRNSPFRGGKLRIMGQYSSKGTRPEKWSGREDSNLRPLPPERVAPECIGVRLACSPRNGMRSDGERWRGFRR
jgi:hypothetical protein